MQKNKMTNVLPNIKMQSKENSYYKCTKCPKIFRILTRYERHMQEHMSENICNICQRGFITKTGLFRHMKTHSKGPSKTLQPSKIIVSTGEKRCRDVDLTDGMSNDNFSNTAINDANSVAKKTHCNINSYSIEQKSSVLILNAFLPNGNFNNTGTTSANSSSYTKVDSKFYSFNTTYTSRNYNLPNSKVIYSENTLHSTSNQIYDLKKADVYYSNSQCTQPSATSDKIYMDNKTTSLLVGNCNLKSSMHSPSQKSLDSTDDHSWRPDSNHYYNKGMPSPLTLGTNYLDSALLSPLSISNCSFQSTVQSPNLNSSLSTSDHNYSLRPYADNCSYKDMPSPIVPDTINLDNVSSPTSVDNYSFQSSVPSPSQNSMCRSSDYNNSLNDNYFMESSHLDTTLGPSSVNTDYSSLNNESLPDDHLSLLNSLTPSFSDDFVDKYEVEEMLDSLEDILKKC